MRNHIQAAGVRSSQILPRNKMNPDDVDLIQVQWTERVDPGNAVSVSFEIWGKNHSTLPHPADTCITRDLGTSGLNIIVEVVSGGVVVNQDEFCWPDRNRNNRRESFSFRGPSQAGDYTFDVVVRRNSDEAVVDRFTADYTVTEDADDCQTDRDCPAGTICDNGQCVSEGSGGGGNGGGSGGSQTIRQLTTLVGLLIVAIIALRFLGDR